MADDDKSRSNSASEPVAGWSCSCARTSGKNRSSDGNGRRTASGEQDIRFVFLAQAGENAAAAPSRNPQNRFLLASRASPSDRTHTAAGGDRLPAREEPGRLRRPAEECGTAKVEARQARNPRQRLKARSMGRTRSSDSAGKPVAEVPAWSAALVASGGFCRAVGRLPRPGECQQPPQQTQGRRLSRLYRAGGDKTRVRVGPIRAEAAEAAMAKLKRIGLQGRRGIDALSAADDCIRLPLCCSCLRLRPDSGSGAAWSPEVLSLVAWVVAIVVARTYSGEVARWLTAIDHRPGGRCWPSSWS